MNNSRRSALAIARVIRTIDKELETCFTPLANKLTELLPPVEVTPVPVAVGQIRRVKYPVGSKYDTPDVVVLKVRNAISDDIEVAQMYGDTILAGEGDLILAPEQTGGAGTMFVECWNTYTLKASNLEAPTGQVEPHVVEAIIAMGKNNTDVPTWAPLVVPMSPDDPRIDFRKLEVWVAFFASIQSSNELLDEMDAMSPEL